MSALRGIAAGVLGLAALQVVVSSRETARLGALLKVPGDWARWFLDPRKPLIPDLRTDQTRSIGAAIIAARYGGGTGAGGPSIGPAVTPNLSTLPPVPNSGSGPLFPPAKPPYVQA